MRNFLYLLSMSKTQCTPSIIFLTQILRFVLLKKSSYLGRFMLMKSNATFILLLHYSNSNCEELGMRVFEGAN